MLSVGIKRDLTCDVINYCVERPLLGLWEKLSVAPMYDQIVTKTLKSRTDGYQTCLYEHPSEMIYDWNL